MSVACVAFRRFQERIPDGEEPRLVLDSSVCNANTLCTVPERVSLPSALDVQRTFQRNDAYGANPSRSQRMRLFRVEERLYHYTVCHFGAKFSAYWWQRVASQITRILHALLSKHGHKAWLCVDDLLAMLARSSWEDQVVLITCLLSALHAPISWRKAQLGNVITWCGWTFHLDLECLHLVQAKLAKLRDQLDKLANSKKILPKFLESSLGLLMWATSTCPHLRPYLAPLYKDLRSSNGTLTKYMLGTGVDFATASPLRRWSPRSLQACGPPQTPNSWQSVQ